MPLLLRQELFRPFFGHFFVQVYQCFVFARQWEQHRKRAHPDTVFTAEVVNTVTQDVYTDSGADVWFWQKKAFRRFG